MKKTFPLFPFLFIAVLLLAAVNYAFTPNTADVVLGKWLNEEKDGAVEIFKKGNNYYGKLVWLKRGPNTLDEKNPDAARKNDKLLGKEILQKFSYDNGSKQWQNGTIYDPKSGKTYSCKMWLNADGSLSIRGYIGFSMIGRTTVWTRPDKGHPAN